MLFLDANTLGQSHLSMGQRSLTALLGYAVVFAGLLVLMAIVFIMGAIFKAKKKKSAETARSVKAALTVKKAQAAPAAEQAPTGPKAPGSAGEVKRFDVPDKEAAMIMAIVADQMGKPLNELRFKSIKEVK